MPAVLDGKGFQRDTVEYAFERLYQAEDSTRRFLVADEVCPGSDRVLDPVARPGASSWTA